jgi:hypothetical protein
MIASILVLLVIVILAAAWAFHSQTRARGGTFCPGPYNMQIYDSPYFYPYYEARAQQQWDADRKCVSFCGQSPCTIWCR